MSGVIRTRNELYTLYFSAQVTRSESGHYMPVIYNNLIECNPGYLHSWFSYVYLLFMVVDIDECKEPNICGPRKKCSNQPATYVCLCAQGYEYKDRTKLNCTGTKSLIVLNNTSIELPIVVIPQIIILIKSLPK